MTGDAYIDAVVAGVLTAMATIGGLLIAVRWALSIGATSTHLDSE